MESIHQSSEVKGFVRIDHYSSLTRGWETTEFKGDCFSKALADVQRIEDDMCNIPNIVNKRSYNNLPHMRLVLSPNISDTNNIALYNELQNRINSVYIALAKIREFKKESCNDFDDKDRVANLTRLLKYLQNIDIGNCSWEYLESVCHKIKNVHVL